MIIGSDSRDSEVPSPLLSTEDRQANTIEYYLSLDSGVPNDIYL